MTNSEAIEVLKVNYPDPCYIFLREAVDTAIRALSAQPEVVYCKKCKHWTRTCGDEQWGLGDCDVFDKHLVMCNGFCAWAERGQDESD